MKSFLLIIGLAFMLPAFAGDKAKVKFKKDRILVDKVEWASYSRAAGKFFMGVIGGEDFLSYSMESFVEGYHTNGQEKTESYLVVEFLMGDQKGEFEINVNRKQLVRLLVKEKVFENNTFSNEAAATFRKKYAQDISGRRFLTK